MSNTPASPPSVYTISTDYSPTNSPNEDGASLASFGSVLTPPFLREMVRDVFGGSLHEPHFPSSGFGSPPEMFPQHDVPAPIMAEHLNDVNFLLHESFTNPGNQAHGPNQSSWVSEASQSTDHAPGPPPVVPDPPLFGPDSPPFVPVPQAVGLGCVSMVELMGSALSSNPSDVDELAGSTSSLLSGSRPLVPPNSFDVPAANGAVEELLPPPVVRSKSNDEFIGNTVASDPTSSPFPDDPSDLTYAPSKAAKRRSKRQTRSSGCHRAKSLLAAHQLRDARGRFKSAPSAKRTAKKTIASPKGSLTLPLHASPLVPDSEETQRIKIETAANTFMNTVGTSVCGARPFVFDNPNPFDPQLASASVEAPVLSPTDLPVTLVDLPPNDPRIRFRASFQHLYRCLCPLLATVPFPHEHLAKTLEVSQTLYETQEWYMASAHLYPDVTGSVF
ncbi:hypothetical protein MJO29_016891 [Puccinia striiformis f. sp. tritici]|nr:hypothetical protein MJO29_016891 [Puccinia striiformis f. sp. tritici]